MIARHVIFGVYGFWLPNDPRGSWSDFVGSWELFRYGPSTQTTETRSLAQVKHDRNLRLAAKRSLNYPPVEFTGLQARAVGRGFAQYAHRAKLPIWACAILPDHVHLVMSVHRLTVKQIVIQLKGSATRNLVKEGLHPFAKFDQDQNRPPQCFARGEWKVFLDAPEDVFRSIKYVEKNPLKEGKPAQRWNFVEPFAESQ